MIHRKSQLSVPKTRNPYIRHSIYCKPYYILGSVKVNYSASSSMGAVSSASRPLQEAPGPAGPSICLQGPPASSRASRPPGASKASPGVSRRLQAPQLWNHPFSTKNAPCRVLFLKGSERPEAGCLGEFLFKGF